MQIVATLEEEQLLAPHRPRLKAAVEVAPHRPKHSRAVPRRTGQAAHYRNTHGCAKQSAPFAIRAGQLMVAVEAAQVASTPEEEGLGAPHVLSVVCCLHLSSRCQCPCQGKLGPGPAACHPGNRCRRRSRARPDTGSVAIAALTTKIAIRGIPPAQLTEELALLGLVNIPAVVARRAANIRR